MSDFITAGNTGWGYLSQRRGNINAKKQHRRQMGAAERQHAEMMEQLKYQSSILHGILVEMQKANRRTDG